jgi:uncharacterized protein involved in exopolysaccharide biosynthesis
MNKFVNSDNEIDIKYILKLIQNQKNIITKTSFFGSVFFLAVSFTQPVLYTSNISFFKVKDISPISSFSVESILGGSGGINERLEVDIKDILSSQKLSIEIVNRPWKAIDGDTLISFWELDQKSFLNNLVSFLSLKIQSFSENQSEDYSRVKIQEAAVKEFLEKRILIKEDLKTGLISVSLKTENRNLSVEILNFIKEFVLDFSSSNIKDLSLKEVEYLNTRIKSVEVELQNIHSEIVEFLEKNKNYSDSPELTILFQNLIQDRSFVQNIMITLFQQVEIAKLNQLKISPIIETLDSPSVSAEKSSPKRLYWLFFGFIVGSVLSISFLIYPKSD